MGDRGPTATIEGRLGLPTELSRWEIGDQPQRRDRLWRFALEFSRWEIGDQPQLQVGVGQVCA